MSVHKKSSKMFYGFGVCSSLYAINSVNNQLNHPINYDNSHTDLPKAFDLSYYKYDTCFIY